MGELQVLKMRTGPGGFFSGIASVFWGSRRIMGDPEMRKLAILPLILTSMIYTAAVGLIFYFSGDLLDMIWTQPEGGFLRVLWYIVIPFLIIALLLPFILLFSTIAEAVGGPFYDKLAMRVLGAHQIPTKEAGLLRGTIPDIFRSLAFTAVALFCSLLAFIPVVGIAFAVIGAVIAWLGLASAAINPALMATGLPLSDRLGFTFRKFFAMAGVGAVVWAALFVPFLGLFALPSAVVGASELYARSARG